MALTQAPYSPPGTYGPLSGPNGNQTNPGLQIVDLVSTNLARYFKPHGFVYEDIVAPMQTYFNVGEYPVFRPQDTFGHALDNLAVADDAPTPIWDLDYALDNYKTQDYRASMKITRKEAVQAHPALRLDYVKPDSLLTGFALNKEYRLASLLLPTSLGGSLTQVNAIAPSVSWDAGTSTSPASIQGDIQSAILTAYKQSGVKPNTIVLDLEVALAIANDYTLKDQIKYQIGPRVVAEGLPAVLPPTLFGLNVVIADGVLANVGRPGDNLNLSSVWGNYARVLYCNPNAGWGEPSVAYAIRGRISEGAGQEQPPDPIISTDTGGQEPGGGNQSIVVDQWWVQDPPARHIRVWENVVEKLAAPDLGVCIGPCVTAANY